MSNRPAPRAQSKSVTAAYGGVSAVLLVIIATVALIVKPPSPPALAEFAPQADETIDEALENQSSRFGRGGDGSCGGGQLGCGATGTSPEDEAGLTPDEDSPESPKRPIFDKGRIKRCVGDPPTQIEDPQSPPCAEYFDGDNGGATSQGVTRDEIRVAILAADYEFKQFEDIVGFFNRRFEFYKRHVKFVWVSSKQLTPTSPPAENQRYWAQQIAALKPFAAVSMPHGTGSYDTLHEELASRKIISIVSPDDRTDPATRQRLHPFVWSYEVPYEVVNRGVGELACRALKDDVARWGGADVAQKHRAFAVLEYVDRYGEKTRSTVALTDSFRSCGLQPVVRQYRNRGTESAGDPDGNRRAQEVRLEQQALLADLRNAGVTTIVPTGFPSGIAELMESASVINYEPEWLLPGTVGDGSDAEVVWQAAAVNQTAHLMAVASWNKGLPPSERAATWAYQEEGVSTGVEGTNAYVPTDIYRALLVLSSGIQTAGPALTPESFGRGLQATRFPNVGAGAAPYYQASVGFARDHAMVDDLALTWWSQTAPAYSVRSRETGGWCYSGRGARWRLGSFPTDSGFFSGPCR